MNTIKKRIKKFKKENHIDRFEIFANYEITLDNNKNCIIKLIDRYNPIPKINIKINKK